MTEKLGTLKRVDLRKIWEREDGEFTPWLSKNLSTLGDALELSLELHSTEAPVGDFSVDLLARDLSTRRLVVIENQIEATDHDHLGKLLTYASGYDVGVVIWVASAFRDEHRQALDWLNQHTDSQTHFFGVVIEALQIDSSLPAPHFKVVAAPNDWRKAKVGVAEELSPREGAYKRFFQGLLDEMRDRHQFTTAKVAQPQSWYSFSSGNSGFYYAASFAQGNRCRAEVYIDMGDKEDTKKVFDEISKEKSSLEAEFGEALTWERLDEKRASRVAIYREGSIDTDTQHLNDMRQWYIEHLLKFRTVFGKRLNAIAR